MYQQKVSLVSSPYPWLVCKEGTIIIKESVSYFIFILHPSSFMKVSWLQRTFLLAYHTCIPRAVVAACRRSQTDDDANGFAAAAAAGNAMHVTRTDKSCVLVSMIRLQAASKPKSFLPNCYCFVVVPAWNILPASRDPKSVGFER